MPIVAMPDGTNVQFPDEMPPEKIKGLIASKFPDEVPEQNFFERVGGDIQERQKQLEEINRANRTGEQGALSTTAQQIGKVGFGTMADIVGEGAVSAARGLSNITPDAIENPVKDVFSRGVNNLMTDNPVVDMAKTGMNKYQEFAKEHPEASRNIDAATNAALFLAPTPKAGKPMKPTVLGKAGSKIGTAAQKQTDSIRNNFIDDLVTPVQDKATRLAQVDRTSEARGLLRTNVVSPDSAQREIADVLSKTPVSKKLTIQGNYNIVKQEISKEAEALQSALAKTNRIFPKRELTARFNALSSEVDQLPSVISGNKQAWAKQLVSDARAAIDKYPGTPSGMLQARKDLDAVIKKYRPKAFDPVTENALSEIVPKVRGVMNDFIAEKAPNAAVKQSLKKQSILYNAKDILRPKAELEANNALGRLVQNASKTLGMRTDAVKLFGLVSGIGGIGLASLFPPVTGAMALGTGLYGLGKAARGPAMKKGLSRLLKLSDMAIRKATDKSVIRQMRADRAAILEMMKNLEGEE